MSTTAPEPRGIGRLLFVCLLSLYLVTGGGKGYSVDGGFGYEMAKTVFLDPKHEYFQRFKSAFARWGALLPLLGQPFVLAGDALSRVAPERDALVVDGHTFRVEDWPALGAGGRFEAPLPEGGGVTADRLAIVSFLSNSLATDQGATVGQVRVWSAGQPVVLPVRAGVETAEWAYDRPDVRGLARHQRPRVVGQWIGQPRGNLYYAEVVLPNAMRVTSWELLGGSGDARWHVRAAAFREAGSGQWRDAQTGARFWSERQTRDFFTRLGYSTLNAFTTAGTAALVYAILGLLEYGLTTRVVAALGYGVATMAWPYAKLDFSEPASTMFALLAVWALLRVSLTPPGSGPLRPSSPPARAHSPASPGDPGLRAAFALGALASLGLLLAMVGKYTAGLWAGAVLAQWAVSSGWWQAESRPRALAFGAMTVLPAGVLGVLAVAVMAAYAGETPVLYRNLTERLREDWLSLPLWTGLRGLLFSPGKSLFLYSPWLLLALPGGVLLWRRHRRLAALFTVFPAVVVVLYGMKLVWHGGGWGPRYLVPMVPLLSIAAAPAVEWLLERGRATRGVLVGLAAVSVGVQLLGVAKDPEQFPTMVRQHVAPALPDLGSRLGGRDYWVARGGEGLARALLDPRDGGGAARLRGLGYLWGYPDALLELPVTQERSFALSLYFVDWDRQARRQTVEVEDALGLRVWQLDTDFSGGVWGTWEVMAAPGRPVRVRLTQRGPDTAVLSAAVFDAPRGERREAPVLDRETKGNWLGRYGAEGYVLFAWHSFDVDQERRPNYLAGVEASHTGDRPDPRIHVEIAEADLLDTPLLYAAPFSPLLGNAWLLAADTANLVLPARADLAQAILGRPPWTWFGVAAPRLEQPAFGLGLDFWPTLLYTNYASHSGVIGAMWVTLLALEAVLIGSVGLLLPRLGWPARLAGTWVGVLAVGLMVFDVLQVRG
ncbi:MAG: Cell division protein FtsK [uncultured Chloroflexi bacterium]|uniref:Cell division protein FtsK n=1 Tax=uncultured Chloroflexota bacterium TaxID=166587 RepID=A0A6J4JAH4_9CHLR|nr:MAG: Cell division protein FtsK [uncultured Chloroflexota bacterium]